MNLILATKLALFTACLRFTVHGAEASNTLVSRFLKLANSAGLVSNSLAESSIYAKVIQLEAIIVNQYNEMHAAKKADADKGLSEKTPKEETFRFTEASELPEDILMHIIVDLNSWMRNPSNPSMTASTTASVVTVTDASLNGVPFEPAPHIRVYRKEEWKTTVIMYRPSLRPQVEGFVKDLSKRREAAKSKGSSAIPQPSDFVPPLDPQLSYYEEAACSVERLINEAILPNPTDQFIFVGFGGGAAVAVLQTWLILGQVHKLAANLVNFGGELHQIKLLLFNAERVLTSSRVEQYPVPACDVLRFNSEDFQGPTRTSLFDFGHETSSSASEEPRFVDPPSFEFRGEKSFVGFAAEKMQSSMHWVAEKVGLSQGSNGKGFIHYRVTNSKESSVSSRSRRGYY
jgi:hypothetical protein